MRWYQNFSVQLKLLLNFTDDRYNFGCSPTQFVVPPNSELFSSFFGVVGWEREQVILLCNNLIM